MNNLTLVFDPLEADPADLAQPNENSWEQATEVEVRTGAKSKFPCATAALYGPDLASLAKHWT